ncbi:nurim homolog [Belonocnema kinseyi]|uniref:nurim homolog n=1 Tax=Belonocnema kinseyi TaxID=2817044 RepID=UPI00143DCBD0|nr:nurim homolog [Belonocnema kinseyi]
MLSETLRFSVWGSSFLYTFYVLCNFMYFLSNQYDNQKIASRPESDDNLVLTMLWDFLIDTCLISAFILQHSVMASDFVKRIYSALKIEDLDRSVYNACSAAVLHLMVKTWVPVSLVTLWNINTTSYSKIWLLMTAIHVLGWVFIYSGCLMMDISELVGLKQVLYKISCRPCPMNMKSRELRRFYGHMRHPSFTGFLMILWIHPIMSIDRLLLAVILTVYMIGMWNIDEDDYRYHSYVIQRKKRELS